MDYIKDRIAYAKADLKILKANGEMAITGTKLGPIWLKYEKGLFRATDTLGKQLMDPTFEEEEIMFFIASNYAFAIVN